MAFGKLSRTEVLAAHLALVVAAIHVALGMLNWIEWIAAGYLVPGDVRWPLFVLSGFAILLAIPFGREDRFQRPVAVAGIGLMVAYVAGYFSWHATGHRPLLIVGEGAGHADEPLGTFLLTHLFAGPVEILAIAAEVALAVTLAALLVRGR